MPGICMMRTPSPDTPVDKLVAAAVIGVTLSPLCLLSVEGQRVCIGVRCVLLLPPCVIVVVSTAARKMTIARQRHLLTNLLLSLSHHVLQLSTTNTKVDCCLLQQSQ